MCMWLYSVQLVMSFRSNGNSTQNSRDLTVEAFTGPWTLDRVHILFQNLLVDILKHLGRIAQSVIYVIDF